MVCVCCGISKFKYTYYYSIGCEKFNPISAKCDTVAAPEGGSLQLVTNGTQTLAVYTCGVNSSLNGVATQECNLDGTWQSIEPSCGEFT